MGDPEIHGYHCGCPLCDFSEAGPPLMVQRDSTCTGEVISRPMSTWNPSGDSDDWAYTVQVLTQLQQAALDVDAEPGHAAGFHVHVMPTDDGFNKSLGAVLLWEPVLMRIAAGRFPAQRGMNRTVRSMFTNGTIWDWAYDSGLPQETLNKFELDRFWAHGYPRATLDFPALFQHVNELGLTSKLLRLFRTVHHHNDRHSNFNITTNHGTVEYRFWNSTRSAWRMEMFCRLSVAMTDQEVAGTLIGLGGIAPNADVDETWMDGAEAILRQVFDDAGYHRLAELLERQANYRLTRRQTGYPVTFATT